MEIKCICIFCGNGFNFTDGELFMERMSYAQEMISKKIGGYPEDVTKNLEEKNNIRNIKKELKEKGHVRMACVACHLISSWEAFDKHGL